MKSFRYRPKQNPNGFSLVEVVIGLVLMATVLASTLLAYTAHQRQRAMADAKLEAVVIADELLEVFSNSREGIPAAGRGAIMGKPGWFWQSGIAGTASPAELPVRIIRFQVGRISIDGTAESLISVDLVEPI